MNIWYLTLGLMLVEKCNPVKVENNINISYFYGRS